MTNPIGWCDETWNPIVGCTRISPGCRGCYAARMAKRQAGMARARRERGQDPGRSAHYEKVENWDGVALVPEALGDPLKWRKARRVFVCSMSDLFHEDVPREFIYRVFRIVARTPQHTYQFLTKRPARMARVVADIQDEEITPFEKMFHHVHLGVTAEDQKRADERIPLLLRTPAAVRFVSLEPLLSNINLWKFATREETFGSLYDHRGTYEYWQAAGYPAGSVKYHEGIDLVIVGAETGPGKREMTLDWARSLRDQCRDAGVPFFFKKDSDGNRTLDGVMWREMPR